MGSGQNKTDVTERAFCTVDGGDPVSSVLARLNRRNCDHVVAVTDGEVAGIFDRSTLEVVENAFSDVEFVGNLDSIKFRSCRPGDATAVRRRLLAVPGVRALVVCDEVGEPVQLFVART